MKSKFLQEFNETTIGDVCPFIYGKGLPERKRNAGKIPVYGSNGIVGFHDKFLIEGPCVIIGRKGSIGKIHYSKNDCWPIDTTFYIKTDGIYDLKFIFYLLKYLNLEKMNSDSAVPGLNRNSVHKLKIKIPEPIEAKRISEKLSRYEEIIENYQQQNKILQQFGKEIFNSWFSKIITSNSKKPPLGWKHDFAKTFFTLEYGWHLPEWDRKQGKIPVYGSGGLTGYHNKSLINGPGIIVGRAGKIGSDSIYYSNSNFCPIETTFYVKTKNKIFFPYLYFFLKTFTLINTGSSVPNLSRSDVHNLKIIIPDENIIRKFYHTVNNFLIRIEVNIEQIKNFTKIRDTLLPKLMSGEIRV